MVRMLVMTERVDDLPPTLIYLREYHDPRKLCLGISVNLGVENENTCSIGLASGVNGGKCYEAHAYLRPPRWAHLHTSRR